MRVLLARVDLQLREHLTAEGVLREHALDGLLDGLLRVVREEVVVTDRTQTARVTRVTVGELLGPLVAGEVHLVGVDDDDEVTGVDVGGVDRLVLAPQEAGGGRRQTAQDNVPGVDDVPLASHIAGLGAVRTHWS
ncbi:putative 50S ribosomal protein L13 [Streptomyces sp. Tu6071]|nr:putative 50S ribosomal protein L13 [Streptomyces sp. Tu6071]